MTDEIRGTSGHCIILQHEQCDYHECDCRCHREPREDTPFSVLQEIVEHFEDNEHPCLCYKAVDIAVRGRKALALEARKAEEHQTEESNYQACFTDTNVGED